MKNYFLLSIVMLVTAMITSCAIPGENEKKNYLVDDCYWEISLPSYWKAEACRTPERFCFVDTNHKGLIEISILKIPKINISNIANDYFKKNHYEIIREKHYIGKIWAGNIYYVKDDSGSEWILAFLSFNDYFLFGTFVTSDHDFMSRESDIVLDCLVNVSRKEIYSDVLDDMK